MAALKQTRLFSQAMTKSTDVRHPVLALEEQRCRSMIDVETGALDLLLHDELLWIHASGRTENKRELLASLVRDSPYQNLVISCHDVRRDGDVFISTGVIEIHLKGWDSEPYFNLFTNIWLSKEAINRLLLSQSTRCPITTKA